ncbi:hypothetical protein HALLA_18805 [Halostagnicola larsenii XH-48]|uniref:Uncharacterized protein n=1 Tax=Halostagnicola larsenii XH-48 TaxID=797299 RepID=W0JV76_9EURY|nr:hypothetical protein [Halostagnicola larsenii]AHG01175.1 hypothetical protein HALLA_18805 [Halostagnicola larsenii XH-48]
MSSEQSSRDSVLGYAVLAALLLAVIGHEVYGVPLNQLLQTGLLVALVVISYQILLVLKDIRRKL